MILLLRRRTEADVINIISMREEGTNGVSGLEAGELGGGVLCWSDCFGNCTRKRVPLSKIRYPQTTLRLHFWFGNSQPYRISTSQKFSTSGPEAPPQSTHSSPSLSSDPTRGGLEEGRRAGGRRGAAQSLTLSLAYQLYSCWFILPYSQEC